MNRWTLPALLAGALVQTVAADAASMATVISGVTGPDSYDFSSLFVPGYEPANAAGLAFEMTLLWDSQPSGLDAANSTINTDAGTSSFLAKSGTDMVTGITDAILLVDLPSTNFGSSVDQFGWMRSWNAGAGRSALALSFHGTTLDNRELVFSVSLPDIEGLLPLAPDAALALAGAALPGASGQFTIIEPDGQHSIRLDLAISSFTTINLDVPVDPPPTDVPLPGALVLLLSGLGGLAQVRRRAG